MKEVSVLRTHIGNLARMSRLMHAGRDPLATAGSVASLHIRPGSDVGRDVPPEAA